MTDKIEIVNSRYKINPRKTFAGKGNIRDHEIREFYDSGDFEEDTKAPYAVVWHGQYMEWYGDDSPESGKGRYKMKGDAGEIVAKNIPTRDEAENALSQALVSEKIGDRGIIGIDIGVVSDSFGPFIIPMRDLHRHFEDYGEDGN